MAPLDGGDYNSRMSERRVNGAADSAPAPAERQARLEAALRDALAARRKAVAPPGWDDAALTRGVTRMEAAASVNPHLPIAWPTWPPGVVPKLTAAAQKALRRGLRWYIEPVVEQQNTFNRASVDTTQELRDLLRALAVENARLTRRLAEVEARLADLESEATPPAPPTTPV